MIKVLDLFYKLHISLVWRCGVILTCGSGVWSMWCLEIRGVIYGVIYLIPAYLPTYLPTDPGR